VGSATGKAKVTTVEENKELATEGLHKRARQTLPQPIDVTTTEDDNNKSQQQIGGVITNRQTDQFWINKIKKRQTLRIGDPGSNQM
jgi:hypothetical protein